MLEPVFLFLITCLDQIGGTFITNTTDALVCKNTNEINTKFASSKTEKLVLRS